MVSWRMKLLIHLIKNSQALYCAIQQEIIQQSDFMSMLTAKALQGNQFVVKLSQYCNLHNFQFQIVELKLTVVLEIWLVNKEVSRHVYVYSGLLPKHRIFAVLLVILTLRKACDINDIQCMLNVIKTVGILFTYSPEKQVLLEECVESFNRGAVQDGTKTIYLRKVKLLCNTRWIERHVIFLFLYLVRSYNLLFGIHNPK